MTSPKKDINISELVSKFYDNEAVYSRSLEACQNHYVTKLSVMDVAWKKDFMSNHVVKPLITAFEALSKQTAEVFADLDSAMQKHKESGTAVNLGYIFVNHGPMFAFFPQYHEIYQRASRKLQSIYTNKDFMAFQQEVKANCAIDSPVKTSSMNAFFSMPLLHLHDYLDVVQQILSGITEAHGDYRNLKQSERMLEETNEKMATVDANLQRLERLRQLQSKFEKKKFRGGTVNLIEDGRVLLHHGTLQKQSKRNVHHQYHFHLFNDSLCYSKVNASGKFVLHREMPLATCCVDALEKDIDAIRMHKFKLASAEKNFPDHRTQRPCSTSLAGEDTGGDQ